MQSVQLQYKPVLPNCFWHTYPTPVSPQLSRVTVCPSNTPQPLEPSPTLSATELWMKMKYPYVKVVNIVDIKSCLMGYNYIQRYDILF